jgi:hypothetical protein
MKKILGPKIVEITRGWRKLYNEELHDLGCCEHSQELTGSRKCGEFLDKLRTISFSKTYSVELASYFVSQLPS